MSTPKHTPLPWEVHETGGDVRVENADGECVARAYMGGDFLQMTDREAGEANEEGRANAAFIVRAVNAHEDLLEALKIYVHAHDHGAGVPPHIEAAARAAIAKATGGA